MAFTEMKAKDLNMNPFTSFNNQWALLTAEKDGKVNTMTVSWGGTGILRNKEVATVYIRPQRYTKEFVDNSDTFSLSFFSEEYKDKLTYCGRTSGRDEDKIAKTGLTVSHSDGIPFFEEAESVLLVKKLFVTEMKEENFIDKSLVPANYANNDFHSIYIGEIVKALKK